MRSVKQRHWQRAAAAAAAAALAATRRGVEFDFRYKTGLGSVFTFECCCYCCRCCWSCWNSSANRQTNSERCGCANAKHAPATHYPTPTPIPIRIANPIWIISNLPYQLLLQFQLRFQLPCLHSTTVRAFSSVYKHISNSLIFFNIIL